MVEGEYHKQRTLFSIAVGFLLSALISVVLISIFSIGGQVNSFSIANIVRYFLFLMSCPFRVIRHYPETAGIIVLYGVAIVTLQKKRKILQKIWCTTLVFVLWELLGLMVMVRQMFDF